jgi:DNA gyrase inhibitor GyrI
LPGAWADLQAAIQAAGERTADGPFLEIYRSDMASTPPQELQTDLFIPIE